MLRATRPHATLKIGSPDQRYNGQSCFSLNKNREIQASPDVFQEYENLLVEEFGSMRGLCKVADLHSVFTRCHSLLQGLKDSSSRVKPVIMLPKVCAASVVALLFWGISTSSRFLDDEDTDRFKGMLARRRKLHVTDVASFQCHWRMATNFIAEGEGKPGSLARDSFIKYLGYWSLRTQSRPRELAMVLAPVAFPMNLTAPVGMSCFDIQQHSISVA